MQTEHSEHRINYVSLANRVRDLKQRSMSSATVKLSDDEHFALAFDGAMTELAELHPLIKLLKPQALKQIKSYVGSELANRPRKARTQKELDLTAITVTGTDNRRDFVEVTDGANKYSFERIGRKIMCSSTSAGFKATPEVRKFVREYFATVPRPKKVRPSKKNSGARKFPKVEYKQNGEEIIVHLDDHFAGRYKCGRRHPVLVTWLKDETKVMPAVVPEGLRELSREFVRIKLRERLTHQKPMFPFRV